MSGRLDNIAVAAFLSRQMPAIGYNRPSWEEIEMSDIAIDKQLDATGLTCPLPLLKAKQALNGMAAGEVLEIVCTDPGSVRDFDVFSKQSGNALLKSEEADGRYTYWLKKV